MTQATEPVDVPHVDDDEVDIKDFTLRKKRVRFKIDDDIFEAHTTLSLPLMQRMVKISQSMGGGKSEDRMESFDAVYDIFDQLLLSDSAKRFKKRATSTGEDGIDVQRQLIPILYHLLEEFGVRPTQPSSASSPG